LGQDGWKPNCASTLLNKYPIHVHRHLALLTTQFMEGPGRPLESISRSAVLTGSAAGLLPSGSPTDNRVRIIEFETPASILCGTAAIPIPDTYKTAYFNLVSTGFKSSADSTLRFFFRFAGSPIHLRKFAKLTITVLALDASGQKQKQDWPVDLTAKGLFTLGVELLVGTAKTTASLLLSDGTVSSPESLAGFAVATANNAKPGLFVSIAAAGTTAEFWADVSLLHSRAPAGSFDFGWLFSEPGGPDAAAEVTAKALARMVEAQARIVSVSPPISIV
jgi:hypothetical protein